VQYGRKHDNLTKITKKGELLAKINKTHLSHFPQRKSKILAVLQHFYPGGFLYQNKQCLPQQASPTNCPTTVPCIISIFTSIKPAQKLNSIFLL